MLTIFTTQKPTTGFASQKPSLIRTAIHQANAIMSWGQISNVEILPMTMHGKLGPLGLPYINELFGAAEGWAKNDLLVYANADLILLPDLADAVRRVAERFDRFLAVGQRWDVELDHPLDFDDPAWEDKLRNYVQGRGELHSVSGKDWMAWRRPLGLDIPPFVVGRPCWDNKVVDMALKAGVPVVDATRCVTAVHPEHSYPDGWLYDEASEHNRALCDVPANEGRISEATWVMLNDEIVATKDIYTYCEDEPFPDIERQKRNNHLPEDELRRLQMIAQYAEFRKWEKQYDIEGVDFAIP